jgi:hypothetical protein
VLLRSTDEQPIRLLPLLSDLSRTPSAVNDTTTPARQQDAPTDGVGCRPLEVSVLTLRAA